MIVVRGIVIGDGGFTTIAGPNAVEGFSQLGECARLVRRCGGMILSGGCRAPKLSAPGFQGPDVESIAFLGDVSSEFGLPVIAEVLSVDELPRLVSCADILRISAKNMENFPLLSAVGRTRRPVMLERGIMASIEELLSAAEYILSQGNDQVLLCERGIRTFERSGRCTLDLAAVPILKSRTHLPVFVSPSQAAGDADVVAPLAKAAETAGADGVMIEIQPGVSATRSVPHTLSARQFESLMADLHRQVRRNRPQHCGITSCRNTR